MPGFGVSDINNHPVTTGDHPKTHVSIATNGPGIERPSFGIATSRNMECLSFVYFCPVKTKVMDFTHSIPLEPECPLFWRINYPKYCLSIS